MHVFLWLVFLGRDWKAVAPKRIEIQTSVNLIVAKALHGRRYQCPYVSVCGNEIMRGAAAPKGPMTYNST